MVEQCTIHAIRVRRPTITDDYATRWAVVVALATGERREYDRVAVVGGSITFETRPDSESGPHAYAVVGDGAVLVATAGEDVTSFDVAGNVAWFGRSAPPEPEGAVAFDATRVPEPQPRAATVCLNCGGDGPHFAPPSLGESGYFICERKSNPRDTAPLAQADGAIGVEAP